MRSLFAIVLSTPGVMAEVPSCQQADETTLLQGLVRHRRRDDQQSLQSATVTQHKTGQHDAQSRQSLTVAQHKTSPYDGLAPENFPDAPFPDFETPDLPNFQPNDPNLPDGLPPRPTRPSSACEDEGPTSPNCRDIMLDEIVRVLLPEETYGAIGGKCMQGDMAGYYYGAPVGETSDSDFWIIHLQGGGVCYSMEGPSACDKESEKVPDKFSRETRGPPNDLLSWKDKNLSPFREAHHVYLPYCTEDAWAGQTVTPTNFAAGQTCEGDENCVDQWGFYFSGHLIFKNIIHHILSNERSARHMTKLLLTGSSAGGLGVLNNCDFLQNFLDVLTDRGVLKNSVEVKCSPQAGFFFPGYTDDKEDVTAPPSHFDDFSVGQASVPDPNVLWHDLLLHRHRMPEGCKAVHASQSWKCNLMLNVYPHVAAPLFMLQNKMDYLLAPGLGSPFKAPYVDTCAKKSFISYLGRAFDRTLEHLTIKSTDGWFLASCSDHGNGIKPDKESTIVNGNNSMEIIHEWYTNGPSDKTLVFDSCTSPWGGPCNDCHSDLNITAVAGSCCTEELDRVCPGRQCDCAWDHLTQLEAMECTESEILDLCEDGI